MGINFSDLPPKAQEQVKIKYAIEEARRRQNTFARNLSRKEKKEQKYHAKKTVVDGIEFDSAKEANRWSELRLMEKAGDISDLRRQVEYELIPKQTAEDGTTERAVRYIADFVYTDHDGKTVVEDVKGYKRGQAYTVFAIKRKLMLQRYGIAVKEV